jgi:signal transduction histidine kinase
MKILIVDDEFVSRMTLQNLLASLGECTTVESGEDALKVALSDDPPDLILLDILMPGIDGFEVCKRLKAASQTKDIPVIFLSANTEVEDKTRGIELGAVDYITKPFHKAEVKARVRTHLSIKKMREDLREKNITLERQVDEIKEKTELLREKDIQLIEMDRIAGIGTLAAGIAHEINNPLGFLKSTLGTLNKNVDKMRDALGYWKDKPATDPLVQGYLEYVAAINLDRVVNSLDEKFDRATRGLTRIMDIVNSLKRFSGIDMEPLAQIDINNNITEILKVAPNQEEKKIEIVTQLQDELPLIECAPYEINQCLLQLLKNAVDALDKTGNIKITSEWRRKDAQIVIRIVDSGRGMSPEVLRQAFNPFFTTKPVGSGTGVGLSLTERIIKRYGGMIQLESTAGLGTTATIKLPVKA